MKTPILETERLILRPLTIANAEEAFTNWTSDPDVAKFMTWSTHTDVEVTRAWLADEEKNLDSDTAYEWGFFRKEDNVLIGTGSICYKETVGAFEIGYNNMKSCRHQGYTSEAAIVIRDFLINTLGQKKLYGRHATDNPNSGKVMEKIGLRYTGDSSYDSMDGTKHYACKKYLFEKGIPQ